MYFTFLLVSQCVRFEFIVSTFLGTFTHISSLSALHKKLQYQRDEENHNKSEQLWSSNSWKCISITLKMANFVPKWLFFIWCLVIQEWTHQHHTTETGAQEILYMAFQSMSCQVAFLYLWERVSKHTACTKKWQRIIKF